MMAFLHLAALADAIKRATTIKTATGAITSDTTPTAAEPLAPGPGDPERGPADTGRGSPDDPSSHTAATADAPTAPKAGWFVRAVGGFKAKWRAATVVVAAAVTKTAHASKEPVPSPRAASISSTSNRSIAAKAVSAAPGDDASGPKVPKKTNWFASTLAAVNAECGAARDSVTASWRATAAKAPAVLTPKSKASPKKGRRGKAGATTACVPAAAALTASAAGPDAASSPVPAAGTDAAVHVSIVASLAPEPAPTAPKPCSEAGAAAAPSPPDQAAASVAGVVGGEAAVAC
ncbi:hypothetical protein MNEG_8438 [Monoraphidium neglectum]|uniref:Uncharacterized protein n=1 Tax=Monoraphidium neglectum TaxID=145388 RepID=A0A0D2KVX3_9CHLO|nr:hypothetical protein MNEG_8438 [Monoraphidium neglectum]KIY99523.1 hypothetical protein MNEG_8438 [Monoraphidium neglectum]|eukprot:XP_013898543.1 hypothetical protein MNEG_8438 [Monoraphidium neglectum]